MHGVEGEVEHPRLTLVAFDVGDRLAPKGVGGVVELLDRFGAAEDAAGVEIAVGAAQETVEVREAALLRNLRRLRAQVPFADHAGDVAGFFQVVGQRGFCERKSVNAARVILMAKARLLAAGEQACAGRRAVGAGDVAVSEAHARSGEGVEVRGGDVFAAVEADVGIPHVIADDDEDVRPFGGGRGYCEQAEQGTEHGCVHLEGFVSAVTAARCAARRDCMRLRRSAWLALPARL